VTVTGVEWKSTTGHRRILYEFMHLH